MGHDTSSRSLSVPLTLTRYIDRVTYLRRVMREINRSRVPAGVEGSTRFNCTWNAIRNRGQKVGFQPSRGIFEDSDPMGYMDQFCHGRLSHMQILVLRSSSSSLCKEFVYLVRYSCLSMYCVRYASDVG